MTLKPCKVTQLDDTFWRVDWEGVATVDQDTRRITHSSPRIAEHRDGEWFFCGYWASSLASVLAIWGLTTERSKEETAEGRMTKDDAFAARFREDSKEREIVLKFTSTCKLCGKRLWQGERAWWSKVFGVRCHDGDTGEDVCQPFDGEGDEP